LPLEISSNHHALLMSPGYTKIDDAISCMMRPVLGAFQSTAKELLCTPDRISFTAS
jgi:hypothetical protein